MNPPVKVGDRILVTKYYSPLGDKQRDERFEGLATVDEVYPGEDECVYVLDSGDTAVAIGKDGDRYELVEAEPC